jgi:topoisomerase IA-like protein
MDELHTEEQDDTGEKEEKKENKIIGAYKSIGTYKDIPIYVKYGKYGRYIDYDNKLISLDRSIYSIQEAQAIYIIENNYERKIDNEVSIRNGKYSDYIYHKKSGRKPIFHKLDGFVKTHGADSYKTCSTELFSDWFYDMIKGLKKNNTKKP